MTLTKHLNDLAGTDGLQDQGAANALAGTNGLALVGALNAAAGTSGLELQGVLGRLGGVPGVAPDGALSEMAFIKRSAPALWLDARFPYGFDSTPNLLTANLASVETDTTGFATNVNCTISRSTAQASHGTASLALTAVGAGAMSAQANNVEVVPGVTYTAVVSARAATVGRTSGIQLRFMKSDGVTQTGSSFSSSFPTDSTSGWTQSSASGTAPSDAAYAKIYLHVTSASTGAGEVHYFDQMGLWQGPSTAWRPPGGYTDGAALPVWADLSGNGRHVSQTTPASQPLYRSANPNLLTYNQATVETGTTGFYSDRGTIARSTTYAYQGTASLAHTVTDATSNGYIYTGPLGLSGSPVSPSTQYTASAMIRTETGVPAGRQVYVGVYWYDAGGTLISTNTGSASTIDTTWQQKTYTATSPSNAAYCNVFVYFKNGRLVGEVFYVDAIGLREGSSTTWVPPVTLPAGMPVVQFEPGDAPAGSNMKAAFATIPQPGTVYVVMARQASSAGPVVDLTFDASPRSNMLVDGTGHAQVNAGTALTTTAPGAPTGSFGVHSFVVNGASSLAATNGGATSGNAGTNTLVANGVGVSGYSTSGAQRGANAYAVVLVFTAAHDTTTRQRIERALGRIYGVTVA